MSSDHSSSEGAVEHNKNPDSCNLDPAASHTEEHTFIFTNKNGWSSNAAAACGAQPNGAEKKFSKLQPKHKGKFPTFVAMGRELCY